MDSDEPLAISAPIARKLSQETCNGCGWYHGLWQYLRIFDMVSTPARHSAFYRDAQLSTGLSGLHRILIVGNADYGMLAQVLNALGSDVKITAIDLCDTPLALCRWYAERRHATVRTDVADITHYVAAEPFDLICTHSLLGRFTPSERRKVIAACCRLLRRGGRFVTVNRVAPLPADETVTFGADQILDFENQVVAAARAHADLALDLEELASDAREYARLYRNHPIHSRDEFTYLITNGGLRIETVQWVEMTGGRRGPSTKQTAEYAHLVAIRD
jgi:SAM-dependent methyltransferase